MMQRGNWVPINKGFTASLPVDRPYTELEAAFCVTCDYDSKRKASISGYAKLWQWSRKRVANFAQKTGWSVSTTRAKRISLIDLDRAKAGKIVHDPAWSKGDKQGTSRGQAEDKQGSSTIYPNPNPNPNHKNKGDTHEQKKTRKKSIDEKYILFSQDFFTDLYKFHNGKEKVTSRDIERAADTIDKLARIDGYDFEKEIKPAIKWAIHDDFWGKQVRSLATLRTKSKNNGLIKFENLFNSFSSSKLSISAPTEEFERTNVDKKLAWEK